MEQIIAMLVLFSFFFGGIALGLSKILPKRFYPVVGKVIVITLFGLLFFMGVRTALIENIESQLGEIGVTSFLYALGAVLFSAGGVVLITLIRRKHSIQKSGGSLQFHRGLGLLKEPFQMIGTVLVGFLLQRYTQWFSWIQDWTLWGQDITTLILFCMLFFVGLNLVLEEISLARSMRDPEVLLLPLLTVLFTLLSGIVLNRWMNHTLQESLAISGGLGWYSFSGVYLAEAGNPVLGSIAFLANLFRELLSVLMIPILGSLGFPYAAITTAGATSMDVTLPIVEHSCGDTYTPASMYHGVVITIMVPVLVPLLYGL